MNHDADHNIKLALDALNEHDIALAKIYLGIARRYLEGVTV